MQHPGEPPAVDISTTSPVLAARPHDQRTANHTANRTAFGAQFSVGNSFPVLAGDWFVVGNTGLFIKNLVIADPDIDGIYIRALVRDLTGAALALGTREVMLYAPRVTAAGTTSFRRKSTRLTVGLGI